MTRLARLWQTMLDWMTLSTEPSVVRRIDRTGNVYFEIHDPVTGKSNAFGSEREIREWLDRYHY